MRILLDPETTGIHLDLPVTGMRRWPAGSLLCTVLEVIVGPCHLSGFYRRPTDSPDQFRINHLPLRKIGLTIYFHHGIDFAFVRYTVVAFMISTSDCSLLLLSKRP